ncbi:MAG: hypothetical protein J5625_03510 [Lachnospiraceae bacterium]|nr:hypothetical protein [Lachnospiraceae bacterium]
MKRKQKIYRIMLVLATSVFIVGCGGSESKIAKLENEAEIQYNAGNLDEALNNINQAEELGQLSEKGTEIKGSIFVEKAKKNLNSGDYEGVIVNIENAENILGETTEEEQELIYQAYGGLIEDIYSKNKDSSDIDPEEIKKGVEYLRNQIKIHPENIDRTKYVFFKKNYGLYLEDNNLYAELVDSLKEDVQNIWDLDLSEIDLPDYTKYDSIEKYEEAFSEFEAKRNNGKTDSIKGIIKNIIWRYEAIQYAFESSKYGIKNASVGDHVRFSEEDIINLNNNPYIDEELSFIDYYMKNNFWVPSTYETNLYDFSYLERFYDLIILNPNAKKDNSEYINCWDTWTVLEKDDEKALLLYDIPVDEEWFYGFDVYTEFEKGNKKDWEGLSNGGFMNYPNIPVRVLTYEEYEKYSDILDYSVFEYNNYRKSWFLPENTSYESDIFEYDGEVAITHPDNPKVIIGYKNAKFQREILKAKILDVKTGLVQDFDSENLVKKTDDLGFSNSWQAYVGNNISVNYCYRVVAWFYY